MKVNGFPDVAETAVWRLKVRILLQLGAKHKLEDDLEIGGDDGVAEYAQQRGALATCVLS